MMQYSRQVNSVMFIQFHKQLTAVPDQFRTDLVIVKCFNCCLTLKEYRYFLVYSPYIYSLHRSQWSCSLRHEMSSLAQTLGSWVWIPLKEWMSMCAFILCLCCPVCR
jgi:hypothetical protein